jgi:acetyltransferase-like isoleucine patch superfamily enzyme
MSRFAKMTQRYGCRMPFILVFIAATRWFPVRNWFAVSSLRLLTKGTKGKNIRIGRQFEITPGCFLHIGNDVSIGDRCNFEIAVDAGTQVVIGASTWISHDFHLMSRARISIGNNVLIGEFVSVRDTTHSYGKARVPIRQQPDVSGSITIADDVWIGRGCLIQAKASGIVIGKGAIIGANAVITKSVPSMEVWAGVPAKFLKKRV